MPKIEVRNRTNHSIARGGWTIPPDGDWHLIDVPEYRIKEVTGATYLEHRAVSSEGAEDTEQVDDDGQLSGGEPEEPVEGGEPASTDEGEEASSSEEDDEEPDEEDDDNDIIEGGEGDEVDLDEIDYRDLQVMAKERGIQANLGREALIEAILAYDEEGNNA